MCVFRKKNNEEMFACILANVMRLFFSAGEREREKKTTLLPLLYHDPHPRSQTDVVRISLYIYYIHLMKDKKFHECVVHDIYNFSGSEKEF